MSIQKMPCSKRRELPRKTNPLTKNVVEKYFTSDVGIIKFTDEKIFWAAMLKVPWPAVRNSSYKKMSWQNATHDTAQLWVGAKNWKNWKNTISGQSELPINGVTLSVNRHNWSTAPWYLLIRKAMLIRFNIKNNWQQSLSVIHKLLYFGEFCIFKQHSARQAGHERQSSILPIILLDGRRF